MLRSIFRQAFAAYLLSTVVTSTNASPKCRTQPGDPGFPTKAQLDSFNSSIDGRLLTVVPSGEFCQSLLGGCPDAEWFSALFRNNIPGAVLQDYTSNPPSLCFRNSTVCGQGNVPVLGVNATTTEHIQAGIRFASTHNLKVAVKASGHDYLGRSTAKNSFLLWTRNFQNITFHDSFAVGGENMGPAVNVGSGVGLHTLYQAAKTQGKIFVGGTAATVVAAGGYVQGAGHSALAPTFGLAADNTLEFQVVIANGSLVTANEVSNPDLFFALRGGGAGSWGVIISATFRVFPTFNAVERDDIIVVNTSAQVAQLAELHARHIFDMDSLNPGQYFYWIATPPTFTWSINTIFPNTTIGAANAAIAPFLDGVRDLGFTVQTSVNTAIVNDVLSNTTDDIGGVEMILGSRLWSSDVYRNNISAIGTAYKTLFDSGVTGVLGNLVAGGQVSRNANISNAVNPKWRTAKTHMIITNNWLDTTTPAEVAVLRSDMTQTQVPVLAAIAGPGSGAYSNEADVNEPDFQTTFFGPNFPRLSSIKNVYDPNALFIVGAGVGSEKWDVDGLCLLDS
ncbi:FAD-binding domain-containing protein [Ramaria rubella]|nr:FAD-binding domain-containing protein [Ramaria rubella]